MNLTVNQILEKSVDLGSKITIWKALKILQWRYTKTDNNEEFIIDLRWAFKVTKDD